MERPGMMLEHTLVEVQGKEFVTRSNKINQREGDHPPSATTLKIQHLEQQVNVREMGILQFYKAPDRRPPPLETRQICKSSNGLGAVAWSPRTIGTALLNCRINSPG